jgi:outer membrane protein
VFTLKNAARQLFYDVAQAYYNVISLQSDENDYHDEIEVNKKRLDELNHFIKIGRSRNAEMLLFQSNISALEATVEANHGQLEAAKATLAYFTGGPTETPLRDSEPLFRNSSLEESLKGIENRPDVIAAMNSSKAYAEAVPIARGGHLPSLNAIGDYYFQRPNLPSGGEDWDIGLQLTVPIFEGGIVQSQVRSARAQANQFEQALSQARRLAEQEIRQYYAIYDADQKQIQKLQDTYNWAKKNYDAELHDYRNGQVTNLDVLQAITSYQGAQRTLDRQRASVRFDSVRLQAAIGLRAETDVAPQSPYKR